MEMNETEINRHKHWQISQTLADNCHCHLTEKQCRVSCAMTVVMVEFRMI
jgi:hypothetical protein